MVTEQNDWTAKSALCFSGFVIAMPPIACIRLTAWEFRSSEPMCHIIQGQIHLNGTFVAHQVRQQRAAVSFAVVTFAVIRTASKVTKASTLNNNLWNRRAINKSTTDTYIRH